MVEGQAPRRTTGRLCWLAALACALLAGSAGAQVPCAAWPEEPKPLPRVRDPDPLRARWAALRVRELSAAARALEASEPARARALWQHARCVAPDDPELARHATAPLPAVVVHRPELARGGSEPEVEDAWDSLSAPIAVASARAASARRAASSPSGRSGAGPSAAPGPSAASVDALVEETAALVRAAQFEAALASAERARQGVAALRADARAPRRARLEVWAATAALALGREGDARASLARALDADPALRLDAATSPKVRRALEAVRAERAR